MSQENTSNKPLIRYVNRQQMSWRAIDVERLIGEGHPARAIWTLIGRMDLSHFYQGIESSVNAHLEVTPLRASRIDPRKSVSLRRPFCRRVARTINPETNLGGPHVGCTCGVFDFALFSYSSRFRRPRLLRPPSRPPAPLFALVSAGILNDLPYRFE